MKHIWGLSPGHKMNQSSHLPARILKFYSEALTGFSHIFSLEDSYLSKRSLKMACTVGMVGGTHIPRIGEGWGASDCHGPAHTQVIRPSCPLGDLIQHWEYSKLNHRKSKWIKYHILYAFYNMGRFIVTARVNAMHGVSVIQLIMCKCKLVI